MSAINITALQNLAIKYQESLKYLPYAVLIDEVQRLGINLYPGVENIDRIVQLQRVNGNTKPYYPGLTIQNTGLGKMVESELKVETAYSYMVDNINNYQEKIVIKPGEKIGTNQNKQLPWEAIVMMERVKTFGEDILDALYGGKRDTSDATPTGCFDGFDEKIDDLIASGEIAAAKGNLIACGSLAAPVSGSDTTAYDSLITWLRQADRFLLKNGILWLPRNVVMNVIDAYENKYTNKDVTIAMMQEIINAKIDGNITLISNQYKGTGDRIELFTPGNMDFGMNTLGDSDFVQVLPPAKGDDPNEFGYWMQGDYGVRIQSWHKKTLAVSDGTAVHNILSGDYSS